MPRANKAKTGPAKVDIEVGKRIRAKRMERNMSQETLANALGLTFQQVQKYEKGTNRIAPSRLQIVADVLNVPIAHFFGPQDRVTLPSDDLGLAMVSDRDGGYIAKRWFLLSKQQQRLLKLMVGVLSKDDKVNTFGLGA